MEPVRIILSGLWVALMLTYLLGDVLRIFAGDITPRNHGCGAQATQAMWLGIAIMMLVPIVMVVLSLILSYPAIRWVSIVVAIFVAIFNLVSLPYASIFDNFLIIFSLLGNALIVWYAWHWT